MANVLQDYFRRAQALNRQRGMTGNMQYGKNLDEELAAGYFDSYQKNKLQSQTIANQKRGLDIQEKGVNADVEYKKWSQGFQEEELAAKIDYQNRMLGLEGEKLAAANAYQMGMLDLGKQEAADRAWYNKENIRIQGLNAESDRAYKMGMLGYNDRALAAQQDAAGKQNTLNMIGFGVNALSGLGSWYQGRQTAAANAVMNERLINLLERQQSPWMQSSNTYGQALGAPYQMPAAPTFNFDPSLFSSYTPTYYPSYEMPTYNPPDLSGYYGAGNFYNYINTNPMYSGAYDYGNYNYGGEDIY